MYLLELNQRATYNPVHRGDAGIVSGVNMLVLRASDGHFLDFGVGFKASGWANKKQALSKALGADSEEMWTWPTGWDIPVGPGEVYHIIFEIQNGRRYDGPSVLALPIIQGKAVAGTLSTTEMTTDLPSSDDDFYNDKVLQWLTGNLAEQVQSVDDYDGATKKLVYPGATEAPAEDDLFMLS